MAIDPICGMGGDTSTELKGGLLRADLLLLRPRLS